MDPSSQVSRLIKRINCFKQQNSDENPLMFYVTNNQHQSIDRFAAMPTTNNYSSHFQPVSHEPLSSMTMHPQQQHHPLHPHHQPPPLLHANSMFADATQSQQLYPMGAYPNINGPFVPPNFVTVYDNSYLLLSTYNLCECVF